jgi:DNA replication ATP-dependent helicase Dna2
MTSHNGSLTATISSRLTGQLEELIASEANLTDRLFRCRQILEEIFKAVTADTNIAFTGLYARMQYAFEASIVSSEKNEQLQLLRLLTNKVVHHDDFDFGEPDFASAVLILSDTITFLSAQGQPASAARDEFLRKREAKFLVPFRSTAEQTVEHIFGVASDWKLSGPKENSKFIELTCQTSEGNQITVTLWERDDVRNAGRRWTILNKVLWKYCSISFYNLSPVHGMAKRYQSTPSTLVVLEQDFLMDVSAIADCFQNTDYYPEMFILNKFFSDPLTLPLARGKYVNQVFDELISEPSKPLKEIFQEYLKDNPQQVFALGEQAWQDIYDQVLRDHYSQLRETAIQLNRQNCQLEPSFISLKYGLHGRLDAITLPDEKSQKYSILELKSGSAHPYDVWKAHQMQVVGYNLILKEIFGAAQIANSSIFYSKSTETPIRHVVNNIQMEQDFLMCRNRIIGILQGLATKPEQFANWLKTNPRHYPNEFTAEKAKHVSLTLNRIGKDELQWFERKLKFIFREVWAVKTGAFAENETGNFGFSSLWNCSTVEKKQQYRIIDNLWVEAITDNTITFHRQDEVALSNLRVGDIIVLYKQAAAVNEQQLIRGTLSYLDDEKVEVRTRCKINQKGLFDKYTLWSIELDLMESALYTGISSVYSFLSAEPAVREKLLGKKQPEFEEQNSFAGTSWRKDVTDCLKGMLAAQDYYLVQGPPGTGKTSCLLMQYMQHLVSETDQKVLLCCFTNRAVDEICSHLVREQIKYIRLGTNPSAMDCAPGKKAVKGHKLSGSPGSEADYLTNRVFVSTVHSFLAAAPDLLNKITLDELIIDEASQILEHHIIGLMSKIRKTILIGDQNQLPPIILQQTDTGKESILEQLINNANKRLFTNCHSMLTNHYRMHNAIARLVGDNYQNKLVPDSERQNSTEPWLTTDDAFLKKILASRIVWIDMEPSLQSKADTCQADWIKQFIERLARVISTDEICTKVGIISPFRAQGQCIISALGNKFRGITVDTVERFQGSERECIIMSYPVRYQHELAMLQSINTKGTVDRKLNVALSRAREQLIILGSSKVLTHSEFFHKVYGIIHKHGLVIKAVSASAN